MDNDALIARIEKIAESNRDWESRALESILREFDCVTGTIHRLDRESNTLHLVAQRGIPDTILDRVRRIPVGKGMAGLAAERRAPVQVCNLQTDDSGDAKPGAKLTEMRGSIAVPMIADGELRGTLGIARPDEYQFTTEQIDTLLGLGEVIGRRISK